MFLGLNIRHSSDFLHANAELVNVEIPQENLDKKNIVLFTQLDTKLYCINLQMQKNVLKCKFQHNSYCNIAE